MIATWADWKVHGVYPKPGGYEAQDPAWMADKNTITRRYNWHIARLTDDETERELDANDFGAVAGVARTEWTGLIGE